MVINKLYSCLQIINLQLSKLNEIKKGVGEQVLIYSTTMKATHRGRFLAITCQAERWPERKDTPKITATEFSGS